MSQKINMDRFYAEKMAEIPQREVFPSVSARMAYQSTKSHSSNKGGETYGREKETTFFPSRHMPTLQS